MSALEERVKTLENHFDISDPESFLNKFNKLFDDFQDITDKWRVNLKLTVGEQDPKVVIEDGKVDGRDLSEDGKVLDTINNTLTSHANNTQNPHNVTAQQAKALPITGGTITGSITAKTNITTTDGNITASNGTIASKIGVFQTLKVGNKDIKTEIENLNQAIKDLRNEYKNHNHQFNHVKLSNDSIIINGRRISQAKWEYPSPLIDEARKRDDTTKPKQVN